MSMNPGSSSSFSIPQAVLSEQDLKRQLIEKAAEYDAVFPDALAEFIMQRGGIGDSEPICARLLAIVMQKFATDIACDAYQLAGMGGFGHMNRETKQTSYTLTAELLKKAMATRGIKR